MDKITNETRRESFDIVDKEKRYAQIIECLKLRGNQTAKELALTMCEKGYVPCDERNLTAPRLTELTKKGIVKPVGKKTCQWTGRTVAVYALVEKQDSLFEV